MNDVRQAPAREEPPPFLGRWQNVYLFVAFELGAIVAALHMLTRWAS